MPACELDAAAPSRSDASMRSRRPAPLEKSCEAVGSMRADVHRPDDTTWVICSVPADEMARLAPLVVYVCTSLVPPRAGPPGSDVPVSPAHLAYAGRPPDRWSEKS